MRAVTVSYLDGLVEHFHVPPGILVAETPGALRVGTIVIPTANVRRYQIEEAADAHE